MQIPPCAAAGSGALCRGGGAEGCREEPSKEPPLVLLVGNPNVGKTAIFNHLTGENERVGNYPGVTVEPFLGTLRLPGGPLGDASCLLADAPGAYSLTANAGDDHCILDRVLGLAGCRRPDLLVAVVDSGQLVRSLYLALELIELRVPLVIALNMIDETRDNPPRPDAVSAVLGVPCVATSAREGTGFEELRRTIARALLVPPRSDLRLDYPEALVRDVDRVLGALPADWASTPERDRALALWALCTVDPDRDVRGVSRGLRERCRQVVCEAGERDIDQEAAETRYGFLDENAPRFRLRPEHPPPQRRLSQRVDRVLLHPVLGFATFIGIMLLMFQSLFACSQPVTGLVERGMTALQDFTVSSLPPGIYRNLLAEGVIAGVGNVVVFLPQIVALFLFIALLEGSGYMARVALLMDRIMRSLGLPGHAFVPMLSAYACAVPAIMATRTMERRRDRLLTMLVIPLMTCSARLPVYTLIVAALVPPVLAFGWVSVQSLLLVGMYALSLVSALTVAWVLGRTVVRGQRLPLLYELPPYRVPSLQATARLMGTRSFAFLRDAGTVILLCTIVVWGLLTFPRSGEPQGVGPSTSVAALAVPVPPLGSRPDAQETPVEESYAGRIGKALEPVIEPLGFDWTIGVGLIGAFAGREAFVSTMALVHGIGDPHGNAIPLRERMRVARRRDGSPQYSPLVGLSLLVFFGFACQCTSTLAVIRRESRSLRWPIFVFGYTTVLAYVVSLLVYQGGRLLGF